MQLQNSFALIALTLAGPLVAQPTLDYPADGLQPIGASYPVTSYTTPTAANFYGPGPAGADQLYGFWMLPNTGGYGRYLDDPSVTSTSASFTGVTVTSTNGGQDTSFYKVDANGIELVGLRGSVEGIAPYTNGALELPFPCTYGTTWNDAFSASYTTSGIPVNRAGTINGIADGYGTIQLPQVQLDDILRVKVRKVQLDQSIVLNVYRTYDTYYYYQPGIRYPVMKISQDTVIFGGGTPAVTFTAEWLYGPGEVGMDEVDPNEVVFTPYPNPTEGRLDLRAEAGTLRSVEVLDAQGKLVLTERPGAGGLTDGILDLSGVPAGVYHLRVTDTDGRTGSRRVVIR